MRSAPAAPRHASSTCKRSRRAPSSSTAAGRLRNEAGEYQLAVRDGLIPGEDHVRAELGEVLAGLRPGRTSGQELTLFRSLGLAVEDLAAAELAVANAHRQGIGTEVQL